MKNLLLCLLLLVTTAHALMAAPVLLGSHKLVKGLFEEIERPNTKTQQPERVTNMLKKLVTECNSDAYVLVNIPGLELGDMTRMKEGNWPNLVKYLHMSSTVVGLPWMEGTLDFAFMEKYIIRTCKAEAIHVHKSDSEFEQYRDVRKRVIRMDLKALPPDQPERDTAIRAADELLRKLLRKLPSPHYTIVMTLSEVSAVHPIPEFALTQQPDHFEIFNDIVNDPRREKEVERNNYMYQEAEPYWNEGMDPTELYIARKKNDEIHLFDYNLWKENEQLVTAVALITASLFMVKILGKPLVRLAGKIRSRS